MAATINGSTILSARRTRGRSASSRASCCCWQIRIVHSAYAGLSAGTPAAVHTDCASAIYAARHSAGVAQAVTAKVNIDVTRSLFIAIPRQWQPRLLDHKFSLPLSLDNGLLRTKCGIACRRQHHRNRQGTASSL